MRSDQAAQTPYGVWVALGDMRLLIHLRGVLSYPIHRFCFGSKALNSALVTRVVSDHHVPPGPFLIWERLNDWFLVGIGHQAEYDVSGEAGKALGPLYSNRVSTKNCRDESLSCRSATGRRCLARSWPAGVIQ